MNAGLCVGVPHWVLRFAKISGVYFRKIHLCEAESVSMDDCRNFECSKRRDKKLRPTKPVGARKSDRAVLENQKWGRSQNCRTRDPFFRSLCCVPERSSSDFIAVFRYVAGGGDQLGGLRLSLDPD